MVLMYGTWHFIVPYPATPELISISPLIQENIAYPQLKLLSLGFGNTDQGDLSQIKVTPLNIGYTQIWDFNILGVCLLLTILCYAANDIRYVPEAVPFPL